ncbi:FkbM family methyltransferase [Aquabacterium sp. A7-Y]|uniref:FkbM family methyltransferase n=1 Tax=Aquabacterium sp. A7-Y TaxID=1349605 RepID=UPI00223E651F|nr:FkbM family methyltransferase [Aquabacterium sp. A7-Y]MCW7538925.1 FkbM family methyltransferase [Aquabacterium sp. A7-Y]
MERHDRKMTDSIATHQFLHAGRIVRVNCEPGSRVDESLSQEKFYEHKMLGYITRTARSGVFLDIGANCGHHSVYFSLFAPSTRVIAFEPFPNHYELILKNRSENKLDAKIQPFPVGIAASHGTFETRTNSALYAARHTVVCSPIDELVYDPVSLMKIDVEGMELEVLKGARRVIEQFKPQIFVEAHTQEHLRELAVFLASLGYKEPGNSFNASPTWEFVHLQW